MNDLENSLGDISVDSQCYRIAKNSEVGRHIVVTKPLKKGDIIFKDTPLVTGPSRESVPCCIACYKLLGINSQDFIYLHKTWQKSSYKHSFGFYLSKIIKMQNRVRTKQT